MWEVSPAYGAARKMHAPGEIVLHFHGGWSNRGSAYAFWHVRRLAASTEALNLIGAFLAERFAAFAIQR